MKTFRLFGFPFLLALAAPFAAAAPAENAWDLDPVAWRRDAGGAFLSSHAGRALAPAPKGRRVVVTARVVPERTSDPEYSSMGVGVFDDLDRYWNLAVLKGPDSKGAWHRYELKAMSEGVWGGEETRMDREINKRSAEWSWGQAVDLALSFAPDRVEGVARDAATGAELYRCALVPKKGTELPVPAGRPCLFVSGDMRGRVENVEWTVEDEVPEQTREFPAYRPVGPDTGLRGTATGFFHMENIDGRDWAVDPLGRATVLAGTDWCNPQGSMCEKLGYRPYGLRVSEHYPSVDAWAEETAARLGAWGFTFLPCGSDASMRYRTLAHANAADRLYFSHRLCLRGSDWCIAEYKRSPCTAFPDVFHPDFQAACDWWARQRCAPNRDDPWLVGYFLDNELAWWGEVSSDKLSGLWNLVVRKPDTHPAKQALLAFLAENGGSGGADPRSLVAAATPAQKLAFLRLVAEKYFSAVTAAIRKADPNHMILGCRFAGGPNGVHPVVMEVAGQYCDIVSFNHYPWADLDEGVVYDSRANRVPAADLYREAHDRAGKPFLLTEWSFPALDTGRPCTHGAGQRFFTQAERVEASELYARTLLSLPFFAGYSYFRWVDQPALGISKYFPENSNYGLVSEEGVPYEGLTAMFTRVHGNAAALRGTVHKSANATIVHKSKMPIVSEHDRFFAEAARGEKHAQGDLDLAFVNNDEQLAFVNNAVGFHQEADGAWTFSNAFVRLSGRVGGKYMADEIAWGGAPAAGRWGALLQWDNGGAPVWTEVSRVTSVRSSVDEATGIVSLAIRAEGGDLADIGEGAPLAADAKNKARFAITHRLSLAPGSAEILAEIVSLENIGDAPFTVQALMMRPFAVEKQPAEVETVPNLWKGPVEDYWELSGGSRYGIASTDPGVLKASLWRKEGSTAQHPDVRCLSGRNFALAPGAVYRPDVPTAARIRFLPAPAKPAE